ncbi:MAG: hypothetical protein ABR973_11255 [Candidatus Acidiferrales bacterium]
MEKRALALSVFTFSVACALTLLACGGGSGNNGGTGTVTSVAITPTSATVPLNGTAEFSATVNLTSSSSTSTSTAVTWEVNGTAGGSSTIGTIVASSTDVQVGIYTAPAIAPGTNNNEVNITAVAPQFPGSTTNTATVTSNTAVVTIGGGSGLAITELTTTVPAGGTHHFVATLNGLDDPNATWSVTPVAGVDVGTINPLSGLYTAPDFPPPGSSVTITAQDPTVTTPATATVQIIYSNLSLNGPFAFSYTGNDASGFLAATGSFVADGKGDILSGVEDVESFSTGVTTELPISSGTYVVGPDGRTTATINTGHGTATWQFVLTTNLHGLLIRFDAGATGSGTIDQQNLNDLTTSTSVLSGPYVFNAAGTDAAFKPMALAGRFSANGSGGIPASGTILDVNDNGAVTTADTTLNGSYTFDTVFPGTGRGTITLASTTTKTLEYAFYVVDSTHIHLVEIDSNAFLAGDAFSGASGGGSFSTASLAAGSYVFTSGGTSATVSTNAYAAGGIFTSDGGGHVTGGTLDTNNGGTVAANATISSCAYGIDGTTGRIALSLSASACPANPNFTAYQTAQGSAVIIELDSTAVSTGLVFPQNLPSSTALAGGFAFVLAGQGMFHDSSGSYQPEAEGEITVTGTTVTGTLDIDNFNAPFKNDPLNTTTSTIAAPATNGRGTTTLEGTDPDVTYSLVYYLINANTALLFDQDTNRVVIGSIARQF